MIPPGAPSGKYQFPSSHASRVITGRINSSIEQSPSFDTCGCTFGPEKKRKHTRGTPWNLNVTILNILLLLLFFVFSLDFRILLPRDWPKRCVLTRKEWRMERISRKTCACCKRPKVTSLRLVDVYKRRSPENDSHRNLIKRKFSVSRRTFFKDVWNSCY